MRYARLVVLLSMAVLVLASVARAQQAGEPTYETVWIPLTETPSQLRGRLDGGAL